MNGSLSLSLGAAPSLINTTQAAIDVFLASKQANGQISGLGYWQVANGYTAIALHDSWTNTTGNVGVLQNLLTEVEANQTDCIDDFNDDSMWWGIFLLEMYDLTHDWHHLSVAQNIWTHVRDYVIRPGQYVINGTDMEGGVMWSNRNNETQVNAVTTGLFAELSARLAMAPARVEAQPDADTDTNPEPSSSQSPPVSVSLSVQRQEYVDYAIWGLFWILRCRYIPDQYLVLDHIDLETGQSFDWTFTYNTGQAIAALIAIYDATKECEVQPFSTTATTATTLTTLISSTTTSKTPLPSTGSTISTTSTTPIEEANRLGGDTSTSTSTSTKTNTDLPTNTNTNTYIYLNLACNMARHAMTRSSWIDPDGTLTERTAYPGTPPNQKSASENDDAVGFKAILVRSLAKLYRILSRDGVHPDLQDELVRFITWQFQSLQDRDRYFNATPSGTGTASSPAQYGPWWAGPMDLPTSHSQMAVLDVMAAIHAVAGKETD